MFKKLLFTIKHKPFLVLIFPKLRKLKSLIFTNYNDVQFEYRKCQKNGDERS